MEAVLKELRSEDRLIATQSGNLMVLEDGVYVGFVNLQKGTFEVW